MIQLVESTGSSPPLALFLLTVLHTAPALVTWPAAGIPASSPSSLGSTGLLGEIRSMTRLISQTSVRGHTRACVHFALTAGHGASAVPHCPQPLSTCSGFPLALPLQESIMQCPCSKCL